MIPDVITEAENVNFKTLHLLCSLFLPALALHTFEATITGYS